MTPEQFEVIRVMLNNIEIFAGVIAICSFIRMMTGK